ncbi:hypothetical protein A2U01_0005112 [Trifolium medium]|uniref:Retrotransposon gag domain-containing protein n=1 Tax=Trifolium medium TaxID=97028 RepID=A0A392MAI0_9FABA|nr:hypothetical protein [Trifolium medium]
MAELPPPPPPKRTLGDYGRGTNGDQEFRGFQPANPVAFDIKSLVLKDLKENKFSGADVECPYLHLSHFLDVCDYTNPPGVSESAKRLKHFKYSLTGRAKDWLGTLPNGTIKTWNELRVKFLERFFPIYKFLEKKAEITNFEQGDSESLYDAWERFKLLLKKCPDHGVDNLAQMQYFTQGLRAQTRMLLDVSAGGSMYKKDANEAKELVEVMAHNEYRILNDRGAKNKPDMIELDTQTALLVQSKLMNIQMETLFKHLSNTTLAQAKQVQAFRCDFSGQGHANGECVPQESEEVNYLANSYSQAYQNTQPSELSPLEETLIQFIKLTQENFEAMKTSQELSNKSHEASIKNLESQIGQLMKQFAKPKNTRARELGQEQSKRNIKIQS